MPDSLKLPVFNTVTIICVHRLIYASLFNQILFLSEVHLICTDALELYNANLVYSDPQQLIALFILSDSFLSLLNLPHHLSSSQSLLSPSTSLFKFSFFSPLDHAPLPTYILNLSPSLFFPSCLLRFVSYPPSIPAPILSVVLARAGVWGEGGDNRWWVHSGRAQCDHHEPPYTSGLDVPLVLPAQVQLPSTGEDLPQGCPQGCAWLRWVYRRWHDTFTLVRLAQLCILRCLAQLFLKSISAEQTTFLTAGGFPEADYCRT